MADRERRAEGADGLPPKGDRRRVRQAPKRASYDRETLHAVLDACPIGHVAFVHDGWPQSIPTAIARLDDHLYLHGSTKSRLYVALASGTPACISACRVDALVKARSAFHCSMNYRSAVVFGRGEAVGGRAKRALLERFTERLIPGSADDFRPFLPKELKATMLVRFALDEASVKLRDGDPVDDAEDIALPHWAGVMPIEAVYGRPVPSADLPAGVAPPATLLRGARP